MLIACLISGRILTAIWLHSGCSLASPPDCIPAAFPHACNMASTSFLADSTSHILKTNERKRWLCWSPGCILAAFYRQSAFWLQSGWAWPHSCCTLLCVNFGFNRFRQNPPDTHTYIKSKLPQAIAVRIAWLHSGSILPATWLRSGCSLARILLHSGSSLQCFNHAFYIRSTHLTNERKRWLS